MTNEYVIISPVYLMRFLIGESRDLALYDETMFYKRLPRLIKGYMESHKEKFLSSPIPQSKMKALSLQELEAYCDYELIDDVALIISILGRTKGRDYDPDKEIEDKNLAGAKTLIFKKEDFHRYVA